MHATAPRKKCEHSKRRNVVDRYHHGLYYVQSFAVNPGFFYQIELSFEHFFKCLNLFKYNYYCMEC